MKLIWSPAITLDGYIAKSDGNSDWVSVKDGELFHRLVRQSGCVIVGRRTFEQYKGTVFPVDGAMTFVWTQHLEGTVKVAGTEYLTGEPAEVLKQIENKGIETGVLAGGGFTNNAFVSQGLINEVIITIYPLLFGSGIQLLSEQTFLKLELLETENMGDGVIRSHYKVNT